MCWTLPSCNACQGDSPSHTVHALCCSFRLAHTQSPTFCREVIVTTSEYASILLWLCNLQISFIQRSEAACQWKVCYRELNHCACDMARRHIRKVHALWMFLLISNFAGSFVNKFGPRDPGHLLADPVTIGFAYVCIVGEPACPSLHSTRSPAS